MSDQDEPSYEEVEEIWAAAEDAAVHCIHIAAAINPYPADSMRAEIWSGAFRSAYAREHGY